MNNAQGLQRMKKTSIYHQLDLPFMRGFEKGGGPAGWILSAKDLFQSGLFSEYKLKGNEEGQILKDKHGGYWQCLTREKHGILKIDYSSCKKVYLHLSHSQDSFWRHL